MADVGPLRFDADTADALTAVYQSVWATRRRQAVREVLAARPASGSSM